MPPSHRLAARFFDGVALGQIAIAGLIGRHLTLIEMVVPSHPCGPESGRRQWISRLGHMAVENFRSTVQRLRKICHSRESPRQVDGLPEIAGERSTFGGNLPPALATVGNLAFRR